MMSAWHGEKAYPVQGRAEPEFGPEPSDAELSLIHAPAGSSCPPLRELTPQDVSVRGRVPANAAFRDQQEVQRPSLYNP